MNKIKSCILAAICLILPGCSNNNISYYETRKNTVDLRKFFDGNIEGWGAIFDYQGRQTRSFTVNIEGKWQDELGTLDELFLFDDGEETTRKWEVCFSDQHTLTAKAGDVLGSANGMQKGNAVNMHYILEIPYHQSTITLNMDDWMYLVADDVIVNKTSMKKFGFKVGEIILFMKKKS